MNGALALILARAGSRGVPGKNGAPVAGRPCLLWTVDAARAARGVGRVVLTTDGAELAALGRAAGIEVVERPPELATDGATVDSAARHAVGALERAEGRAFADGHPVVLLYANVPVRPAGLIDRALGLLAATGCDSVQSYAPVGKMHPWWMARIDGDDGRVSAWDGGELNHGVYRRQDLPPAFVPDGGVLVVTRRALLGGVAGVTPGPHAFLGRDRRGVVTAAGAVVDIDEPIDLLVAGARLREGGGVGGSTGAGGGA